MPALRPISWSRAAAALIACVFPRGLAAQSPDAAVQPCDATIVRRETLRDSSGALLYVAPDVVLVHNGELLLAGHASARFALQSDGTFDRGTANAFVVAIRDSAGVVRAWPAPAELASAALRDLRAVPLQRGKWGVLFFQEPSRINEGGTGAPAALWFGVLGPNGWESTERLKLPDGVVIQNPVSRLMHAVGLRSIAAVPASNARGLSGLLLVERFGALTSFRFVPVRGLAYVGVTTLRGSTAPSIVAVAPDTRQVGRSENELFLVNATPGTTELDKLPYEPRLPAHDLVVQPAGQDLSIGWMALDRSDALGRRIPYHAFVSAGRRRVVERVGDPATTMAVVPADSGRVHVLTADAVAPDSIEVNITTLPSPSRGVRFHHRASFAQIMHAARWNDSELVVTLLNGTIGTATTVSTEVFWIKAQCQSNPEGSRVP